MLFSLSKRKPKPVVPSIRIVRIAQREWTQNDTALAKTFFSSLTFNRIKAFADGRLFEIVLKQETTDDYRKGWLDCQRQYAAFSNVEEAMKDSAETTSMQGIEDE